MPDSRVGGELGNGPTQGQGWLAPGLVTLLAGWTFRDIVLAPATSTLVAGVDSERVGFLVIKRSSMASFPAMGPTFDCNVFGLREDNTIDARTFVLQDWLSLTTSEWYAYSTAGGTVRIFEFRNPS